jgi:hypothetical protein
MSLPTTMIFFSFSTPAPTAGEILAQPQSVPNGPGNNYTFQVPNVGGMATKIVNYAAQLSDCGMLILFNSASAISYMLLNPPPSLPQGAKWRVEVENIGAGVLTINPNGLNLDGSASNITLNQNQGCTISTDGSNYGTQRGIGSSGGVTSVTASYPLASSGGSTPNIVLRPMVGFIINDGSPGTNVGPILIARQAGQVIKCKIVVKASDAAIDLTFKIKQNGTDVFSADPTITHGTASGTITTSVALTSVPLAVAADDLFTIDITSGSSAWQFTAQLE